MSTYSPRQIIIALRAVTETCMNIHVVVDQQHEAGILSQPTTKHRKDCKKVLTEAYGAGVGAG